MQSTDDIKNLFERLGRRVKARDEMYLRIGRAIVALSEVEYDVGILYAVCLHPKPNPLKRFYRKMGTFEVRLSETDTAVKASCTSDEIEQWDAISAAIKGQQAIRNLIAHQGMEFYESDTDGSLRTILAPKPFPRSTARELEVQDIDVSGTVLQRQGYKLRHLYEDVARRKGIISDGMAQDP